MSIIIKDVGIKLYLIGFYKYHKKSEGNYFFAIGFGSKCYQNVNNFSFITP